LLFAVGLLGLPATLIAQNPQTSAYSQYGVGELTQRVLARNYGMGGLRIGTTGDRYLNLANPATYTDLNDVTYDLSGYYSSNYHRTADTSNRFNSGGVQGMGIGFPTRSSAAVAIGLLPYSTVGYRNRQARSLPVEDSLEQPYITESSGQGGLNEFIIGGSVQLFDHLNVGLNGAYVFGQVDRSRSTALGEDNGLTKANKVLFENQNIFSGFKTDLGLLYRDTLQRKALQQRQQQRQASEPADTSRGNKPRNPRKDEAWEQLIWRAGGTLQHFWPLNVQMLDVRRVYQRQRGQYITNDTLIDDTQHEQLPIKLGLGGSIEIPQTLTIGLEGYFQDWSRFRLREGQGSNMTTSWGVRTGAEWVPNFRDARNFLARTAYRAGVSYDNTYVRVNGENISRTNFYLGLGIPVLEIKSRSDFFSRVNLGVSYGIMGNTQNSLTQENQLKLVFGVSFVQQWFQERKYR
jgi:hypothetical protein